MELLWKFVVATLFAVLIQPENLARGSPCAEIQVQAPVVALGSPFNASCLVSESCPLVRGRNFHIEWRLNAQILAGLPPANQSSRISAVTVPGFSDSNSVLECCVCREGECQIAKGVTIRGGYPPSAPQNLTCLTNLTKPYTLACKWDTGAETHLPTNYTLHTEIRHSQTQRSVQAYPLPVGQHSCTIPREGFILYTKMRISVTAQNALGTVSSEPLFLEPVESAKFDPPVLEDVRAEPYAYGCLSLRWRLSEQQAWVRTNLAVEVRFRTADGEAWTTVTKHITKDDQLGALQLSGLLHGMAYRVQMRVRYGLGPWSEWGNSRTGAIREKAPTGRLKVWLKVLEESEAKLSVQLLWKPSDQFRANGRNLSFHVFLRSSAPGRGKQKTVCSTQQRHCVAILPKYTRTVYITACNSAGESSPTAAPVHKHWGMQPVSDVTVSSAGNTSLQVNWTRPVSPVAVGYVVEWGPQLQTDPSFLSFLLLGPNETVALISAGVEPYRPYSFSVYPRYHNGTGLPRTAQGYSLQKAPSAAPSMRVGEIYHTRAKLTWDDIPLDQRNGIIQNYTIYYWDEAGRPGVVRFKPTERSVILTDLKPVSIYKAFISASTAGGTVNGTIVTLKTGLPDAWRDVFTVVLTCVGLMLCFIVTCLTCFSKHDRLKMHFWPMIPDPANSSIKTWTEGDTLSDYPVFQNMKDIQDPVPVHLSWFSLLDVPEGQPEKGESVGPTMDDVWLQGGDPSDLGESLKDVSGGAEPAREVVPYATVVFANPYLSQADTPTTVYLRSDSTQPLLGEESPSPRSYQNFHFQEGGGARESMQSQGGSSAFWEEFPLLSVLNMQEVQSAG